VLTWQCFSGCGWFAKTSGPLAEKSDKWQQLSGARALDEMSEAMEHMAGGYGSSSAPGDVPGFHKFAWCMTWAIRLVKEQEVLLDDQAFCRQWGSSGMTPHWPQPIWLLGAGTEE